MRPKDKKLEEWFNAEHGANLKTYEEKASELLGIKNMPKIVLDWDKIFEKCNEHKLEVWAGYSSDGEVYVPPEFLHNPKFIEYLLLHEYLHHVGLEEHEINSKILKLRPKLKPVIFSLYGFK